MTDIVTYENKVNHPDEDTSDPIIYRWDEADANQVKNGVNANHNDIEAI